MEVVQLRHVLHKIAKLRLVLLCATLSTLRYAKGCLCGARSSSIMQVLDARSAACASCHTNAVSAPLVA